MSKQKPACDIPYNIFVSDGRYSNLQRQAALQRVCLSLLRSVKTATLIEFFRDHVREIISVIEAKDCKVIVLPHILIRRFLDTFYPRFYPN